MLSHLPVCVCVCFTSGTFSNFAIVPLQPVVLVNKAPGLTITIRVPTQRIKKYIKTPFCPHFVSRYICVTEKYRCFYVSMRNVSP